ncbi:hypothetical protein AB0N16_36385 [Streptomyces sp. NPDC051105]|uniref:hypothetical protein n=1 Tax=Streptomyces sp. NPDC051105 TaxID=3154843 RepID=UPI0034241EE5
MATAEDRTGRSAHTDGRGRPPGTRTTGSVLARASRPLACAAAVACLSLSLHPGSLHPGSLHPGGGRSGAPADAPRLGAHPPRAAKDSWVLRADRLVLRGARFHGTTTVHTATGTVRALRFTVRSLDAVDLDLTAGRGRAALRLRARPATTSTIKGKGAHGVVTLYVRKLSGRVTGLGGSPLPARRTVTVTPGAVPRWLSHPVTRTRTITLVSATVAQVAQLGGRLSIKGPWLRAAAR